MITVLVIVFLLNGADSPDSVAIPFDPHVTVAECQDAAGPALSEVPTNVEMLGWSCVQFPFSETAHT